MRHDIEDLPCPCGNELEYKSCCGQYIDAELPAPTPETLMRSRYTAFTLANIDYIEKTMRGKAKQEFDYNGAKEWAENAEWTNLTIVNASELKPADVVGYVEFVAEFSENGEAQLVHERSRFEKINGAWFYTDGRGVPQEAHCHDEHCQHNHSQTKHDAKKIKTGRNDPCPCGSGKKYKKCCL